MPMNPEIKAEWVQALRSGNYQQCQNYLKHDDSFCCLGVLCDLYQKTHPEATWQPMSFDEKGLIFTPDGNDFSYGCLPDKVVAWAGLPDWNPSVPHPFSPGSPCWLSKLNDYLNLTFPEIADIIEKEF